MLHSNKIKPTVISYMVPVSGAVHRWNLVEHETHLTQLPTELRRAFAHKAVRRGVAPATVLARSALTFTPLDLTVSAHEPRGAQAVVAAQPLLQEIINESDGTTRFTTSLMFVLKASTFRPCKLLRSCTDRGSR